MGRTAVTTAATRFGSCASRARTQPRSASASTWIPAARCASPGSWPTAREHESSPTQPDCAQRVDDSCRRRFNPVESSAPGGSSRSSTSPVCPPGDARRCARRPQDGIAKGVLHRDDGRWWRKRRHRNSGRVDLYVRGCNIQQREADSDGDGCPGSPKGSTSYLRVSS